MTKKIKLIDRLKSWLVTLGIASVFGLAALGFNAANSYQKTTAYQYQENGNLSFYLEDFQGSYDTLLLYEFVHTYANYTEYLFNMTVIDDDGTTFQITYIYFDGDSCFYDANDDVIFQLGDDGSVASSVAILPIVECYSLPSYEGYQTLRNYALSYNAPQESGNFVTALTSFMSLIGGGIVQLAQSVGAGVVSFASGLFLDSGHLSILGGIIGIFAGIALAVGITSKVYAWVSTLGN